MSRDIEIKVTDNSAKVESALDSQIEQALIAMGMTAETYAKLPIAVGGNMPVDTGRLKNSITYAIAGKGANDPTYQPDKQVEDDKLTKPYVGNAPQDPNGKPRSVYIGSNVEYAEAVEEGTSGRKARHFLRHAITDHIDKYKELAEAALKGNGTSGT